MLILRNAGMPEHWKLGAVLAADVVGLSRLVGADEDRPRAELRRFAGITWWLVFGLTLLLLTRSSMAGPYEDGKAAYELGDYATALHIWKGLADEGNQSAQYALGEIYSQGQGMSRDDRTAAKWYERAAANGHVLAQSRLGAMYAEGRGIPQSLSKAMKWYRRAAQQGDLPAQISLALIYGTGRGVPQNYFQAEKWFRRAAEQEDALAQYHLALIYAGGYDVVPKDDIQALVWFTIAAKAGNDDARKARQSFTVRMGSAQVAEAEKFAMDWLATKAQDKAARCSMSDAEDCK